MDFSLDIWYNDSSQAPVVRKAVLGYSASIGGICNVDKKYAIMELNGFYGITWAVHELGHVYFFIFKFVFSHKFS